MVFSSCVLAVPVAQVWRGNEQWLALDISSLSWSLQTLLCSSIFVSLNQNQIWPKIPIEIIINTQLILQIKTKNHKFLNLKQNFTNSDSDSRVVSGGLWWWQKIWVVPLRWWQKIWVGLFSLSLSLYLSRSLFLLSSCSNLFLFLPFLFCFV